LLPRRWSKRFMKWIRCIRLWVPVLIVLAQPSAAEPGVQSNKLVIGTSLPLSGRLATMGTELLRGMQLGFAQINGVGGRAVELVAKDDLGQPERAVANTRELIAEGVFAMVGYAGSATIEASLALIEEAGVPLIGVASSAEFLREPARPLVFNLRAGMREEVEAVVTQLDSMGITEIAAISQDDTLGRAVREGMRDKLSLLGMRPVVQAQVPARHDDLAVRRSVAFVCEDRPHVIALLLDATNALPALQHARELKCTKQFYVMNEAATQLLADGAAARELAGVIVPQVVPHPSSTLVPLVADYARQAGLDGVKPSYLGLEGYLYARVFGEALRRCGRVVSRRCLVASLEERSMNVGGYRVQFSKTDHRGGRFIEMTFVTSDGRLRR
jgi:ABC-type branched-subunit amino acid transport system substrate-binding protein